MASAQKPDNIFVSNDLNANRTMTQPLMSTAPHQQTSYGGGFSLLDPRNPSNHLLLPSMTKANQEKLRQLDIESISKPAPSAHHPRIASTGR